MTGQPIRFVILGLLAVAGVSLVVALFIGNSEPQAAVAGLPDAGPLTGWLLPYATLATNLAGAVTVGLMLAAAALIPSSSDVLSTAAARAARIACGSALTWSACAIATLFLTLSDTLAVPLSDTLSSNILVSYVSQVPQGAAWLTVAALAAFTAVAAREADRPLGAWVGLALAILALLPPAVTGHAASSLWSGSHESTVVSSTWQRDVSVPLRCGPTSVSESAVW